MACEGRARLAATVQSRGCLEMRVLDSGVRVRRKENIGTIVGGNRCARARIAGRRARWVQLAVTTPPSGTRSGSAERRYQLMRDCCAQCALLEALRVQCTTLVALPGAGAKANGAV